jgi:hypothetical protein
MTVGFLQEYIPRRMRELGHGDNYCLDMRTIILTGGETVPIVARNSVVWAPLDLIATAGDIEITSDFGYYTATGASTRENHYEFTGQIKVTSNQPAGGLTALTIMVVTLNDSRLLHRQDTGNGHP